MARDILREVAEALNNTARLLTELAEIATSASNENANAETEEIIIPFATLEDVRKVLMEKSRDGHTAEVKEILKKYGADKLSAVEPKDYDAILKEAEVL